MSISYYGYYLHDNETDKNFTLDLSTLFTHFCKNELPEFKNTFMHEDEFMCLSQSTADANSFLFALTKDKEVVSFIKKTNPSAFSSLDSVLPSNDEMIGFTSYLYLGICNCIAIAGRTYSPKYGLVGEFVQHYLSEKQLGEKYSFKLEALVREESKEQLLKMEFIGKTSIRVRTQTSAIKHLLNFATASDPTPDLQYIDVTLSPVRGKNIKDQLVNLLGNVSDSDLLRIVAKAKSEVSAQLQDIYVFAKGGIRDTLVLEKDHDVNIKAIRKICDSQNLIDSKLKEMKNNNNITNSPDLLNMLLR